MNPPVGPVALMELTSGVYAFKALALATELDVFTDLSDGGRTTTTAFADRHRIALRPAELLLTACAALGLLRRDAEGSYTNTQLSEDYLVRGRPYYFGDWVRVVDRHEYPAYLKLADSLRGDHPTTWDVERQESLFDPAVAEHFWDGMYSLSANTARVLAGVFDFQAVHRLLDVGGGGAAFGIELCHRHPDLQVTVFDLPFVCDLTRPRIARAGLEGRIDLVSGDLFADALPTGHDALLLSNVLHDWDETDVVRIIQVCADAMPSGGRLLICESFVADDKSGPSLAALMSFNMLVETWGRNYTAAEYSRWLSDAGLHPEGVTAFEGPGANGVLIARKP